MAAHPAKNVEPTGARQSQVQQDEVWERKLRAVGINARALKIGNCLLAVADKLDGPGIPAFANALVVSRASSSLSSTSRINFSSAMKFATDA